MIPLKLGRKTIVNGGRDDYIIAEIGVNHEGDLHLAKKLIEQAKEGGADAVKFQSYKAEKIASKYSPSYWDTSKEPTRSQFELFKKYDKFGAKEYQQLSMHAQEVGVDFMSTPFDLEAVDFLNPLVSCHKIASADVTNFPLLRKVGRTGKPVLFSAGASTLLEVEQAYLELQKSGSGPIGILHCVLNYPTPEERAHLSRIGVLKKFFGDRAVIGYSDHTLPTDGCLPVAFAYALGARVIEKHFTHDKTLPGNDHYHAMDMNDLKSLRGHLHRIQTLLGAGEEQTFLADQTSAVQNARRSIYAAKDLKVGELLTTENLIVKRPGLGVSPIHWDQFLGRKLSRDVEEDKPVRWQDVSWEGTP